jgi:hypothetical protein
MVGLEDEVVFELSYTCGMPYEVPKNVRKVEDVELCLDEVLDGRVASLTAVCS